MASDTVGSIMTASPEGGIVLIAGKEDEQVFCLALLAVTVTLIYLYTGTGSNSLLLKADGTSTRVGGWGHLIGDYGWCTSLIKPFDKISCTTYTQI